MNRDLFTQCVMVKGSLRQTAWIPYKKAVIGKVLKLRGDNGWRVESTGAIATREAVNRRTRFPSLQDV